MRSLPTDRPLTDREREIVRLSWEGLTDREAGRRLGISPSTVRNHRAAIYDKLGLTDEGDKRTLAAVRLYLAEEAHDGDRPRGVGD